MKRKVHEFRDWKGIELGYDELIIDPVDESECAYCLTIPQVQALLALVEFASWKTRWFSDAEMPINASLVMEFANDIRSRLMNGCCGDEDTLTRINPDTGVIEISTDGGVTWTPQPNAFNTASTAYPPLPGAASDSKKCQAAENLKTFFQDGVARIAADQTTITSPLVVIGLIVSLILAIVLDLATVGAVTGFVIAIAFELLLLGKATWVSQFVSADWDKVKCAMLKNISNDGKVSSVTGMMSDIAASGANATMINFVNKNLSAMQALGINNAISVGPQSGADCSGCDTSCRRTWDFRTNDVFTGVTIISGQRTSGGLCINNPEQPFNDFYCHVEIVLPEPCTALYCHIFTHFGTGHGRTNFQVATAFSNGQYNWSAINNTDLRNNGYGAQNGDDEASDVFYNIVSQVPILAFRVNGYDGGYQTGNAFITKIVLDDTP